MVSKSKIKLPKAKDEAKATAPDQNTLIRNLQERLWTEEIKSEAVITFLIEEGVISREKLQMIVTLIEDYRVIQRNESLGNEETYKRRMNAYKEMFKKNG
jgi:hypothetical protein